MKKFKDAQNKVYAIEEGFEDLLPEGVILISDAEADALLAPVPLTEQEISDNKTAQVEAELGGDNIRILIETFLAITQDGSINTAAPADVVAAAKARRMAEL